MRNKFTELIERGVAAFHHEARTGSDQICRLYNRFWAIPSDTRMDLTSDGRRVITGHIIQDKRQWSAFCFSRFWGNVDFSTSGYACLNDMLYQLNLCPQVSQINGEACIELIPAEKMNGEKCACCPADVCPTCCTSESKMPIHLPNALNDIIKGELSTGSSLDKIVERLNENENIADGWFLAEDSLCFPDSNNIYIIRLDEKFLGTRIECPELRELLDKEGLKDIYLVQNGRDFRIGSDSKEWIRVLKKNPRFNLIRANSYSDYTPDAWLGMIKDILATMN